MVTVDGMADQKLVLTDRTILKLPFAASGQYKVRDAELPGLMLLVGRRTKTFMAQGEFWRTVNASSPRA